MTSIRSIKQIINTEDVMMGDVAVGQPLPTAQVKQISPFLLLHHLGPIQIKPGENPMDIGPHPHRGFAPISFVFEGQVAHSDSLGNQRVVSAGGVQWMSAGKGIVHSETVGTELVKNGGAYEMIQLWVNLPADLKMSDPTYQPFDAAEIPSFVIPSASSPKSKQGAKAQVNVICGTYQGLKGPVSHPTEITAYTITLPAGAELEISTNPDWNTLLYQLGGATEVNGRTMAGRQLAWFNLDGSHLVLNANRASRFLLVSAPPINEPISQYGPFVMNRPQEIQQAIEDFQAGRMGTL